VGCSVKTKKNNPLQKTWMQHWVLAAFLACALAAAAADAYVIAGAGRALAAGRFPRVATRTPLALRGGAVGGATMMGAATNKVALAITSYADPPGGAHSVPTTRRYLVVIPSDE